MKKVFVCILSLVMIMALSVTALATGGFVSSPSGNKAPTLEESTMPEGCDADVVITAYADRATLAADAKTEIETVYAQIKATADISTLNADLAKVAANNDIDGKSLRVSDLFDISLTDCDSHNDHKTFTVKLSAETVKNFVGLLHWNGASWDLVDNAKVEGDALVFTVDSFSPFAIVTAVSPSTGDNANLALYIGLMVVSAAALVAVVVVYKKKQSN